MMRWTTLTPIVFAALALSLAGLLIAAAPTAGATPAASERIADVPSLAGEWWAALQSWWQGWLAPAETPVQKDLPGANAVAEACQTNGGATGQEGATIDPNGCP